ncbi:hypothetical protein GOODEAATRI_026511, partial [Goodea atripinnis]
VPQHTQFHIYTPIHHSGDEEVITTLQSFAKTVGEVSPFLLSLILWHFGVYPAPAEHEAAMESANLDSNTCAGYICMLNPLLLGQLKTDMMREVAYTRRKQHQASLQYYCALNALQYRKRVAMLEPMLGYTQAQ